MSALKHLIAGLAGAGQAGVNYVGQKREREADEAQKRQDALFRQMQMDLQRQQLAGQEADRTFNQGLKTTEAANAAEDRRRTLAGSRATQYGLDEALPDDLATDMSSLGFRTNQVLTPGKPIERASLNAPVQAYGLGSPSDGPGAPPPKVDATPLPMPNAVGMGAVETRRGFKTADETAREQLEQAAAAAEGQGLTEMATLLRAQAATGGKLGGVSADLLKTPEQRATEGDLDHERRLEQIRAGRPQGGSGGSSFSVNSPDYALLQQSGGLDMLAWDYLQTKTFPGRRADMNASIAIRAAEINEERVAAGLPPVNPAVNSVLLRADAGSVKKLTEGLDAVQSFKNTARVNMSVFRGLADKIKDTDARFLNRPVREVMGQLGNEDQAAFEAARSALFPEIARLLFNPNLTGVLTDSARREASELLSGSYTIGQLNRVLNTLETDFAAREDSMRKQLDEASVRLHGRGPNPTTQAEAPQRTVRMPDGRTVTGGWDEISPLFGQGAQLVDTSQAPARGGGAGPVGGPIKTEIGPDGKLRIVGGG